MTIKSLKAKKIAILRIVIVARFYHKSANIKCPQNKLYQRFLLVFSSQTKQSQQLLSAALWSIYDIAGPAYRVIIPCTILIAAYRKMDSSNY